MDAPLLKVHFMCNTFDIFYRSKTEEKAKAMSLDNETDVERLCKAIYDNGEQYMDGTAAINFASLRIVSDFVILVATSNFLG